MIDLIIFNYENRTNILMKIKNNFVLTFINLEKREIKLMTNQINISFFLCPINTK